MRMRGRSTRLVLALATVAAFLGVAIANESSEPATIRRTQTDVAPNRENMTDQGGVEGKQAVEQATSLWSNLMSRFTATGKSNTPTAPMQPPPKGKIHVHAETCCFKGVAQGGGKKGFFKIFPLQL